MSTVALEYFIEAPEESYSETEEFIEKVENFFRERSEKFESKLDKSNFSGGELGVDNFKFWTKEERDVEDLIAKSLMVEYNTNWADLRADMKNKTSNYYGENLDNPGEDHGRKVEIIKKVYDFIERGEKEIKDWIGSSRAGFYSPYSSSTFNDENGIVMEIIPKSLAKKIDGQHHILNPIYEKSIRDDDGFDEVLLHELNHAYLDNSSSGDDYSANPDYSEAFNEIFAYYTSYVVNDYKFENQESDLYSRPDVIIWGVELLMEKSREFESRGKESTGINFERNLMEKIAQKEYPFIVFINACLLKEDKKRIKKFEKLLDDLHDTVSSLRDYLDEVYDNIDELIKKYSVKGIKSKAKEIPDYDRLKWSIMGEIETEMLEGRNASYGDLEDINHLITQELENITAKIHELEAKIEDEKEDFDRSEVVKKLSEMEENISAHRQSMEEVISEGEISS